MRAMRRRISTALAAAALCMALGACGSSNNDSTTTTALTAQQYTQFLQKLSQREDAAHQALDQARHASSLAQVQQILSTFAADQDGVAAQLSSVRPPQNAQAANDQFDNAFKDTAAAVRELIPQVAKAGTPQAAIAALGKSKSLQQSGQEVDAALAQLKKLGYTQGS
jgi:hypothetical protein